MGLSSSLIEATATIEKISELQLSPSIEPISQDPSHSQHTFLPILDDLRYFVKFALFLTN